jgi:hypothetical protein
MKSLPIAILSGVFIAIATVLVTRGGNTSVVVKKRAPLPNSWRWEIYRAGRSSPIEQSSVYFDSVATANRAGKEALQQLLINYSAASRCRFRENGMGKRQSLRL